MEEFNNVLVYSFVYIKVNIKMLVCPTVIYSQCIECMPVFFMDVSTGMRSYPTFVSTLLCMRYYSIYTCVLHRQIHLVSTPILTQILVSTCTLTSERAVYSDSSLTTKITMSPYNVFYRSMQSCLIPVSYTHLDVYKRQVRCSVQLIFNCN